MAKANKLGKLLTMDSNRANAIIDRAFRKYMNLISDIAEDIYDSCIEDYYAQYTPTKYDRHGDIAGFNLYSAKSIFFDEDANAMDLNFSPSKLLRYYDGQKNREKRDKVLRTVMDGLRGAGSRKNAGWPQPWDTTYPNIYSRYNLWRSSGTTLDEIYDDFTDNVTSDTYGIFSEYIQELL